MLDFVARVFRGWMNFLLWLILIICSIGGFIVGGNLFGGRNFSVGSGFWGLIIGGFIGLVTVVLSGGFIANFLNMVDNIEFIKNNINSSGNSTNISSTGPNISNVSPLSSIRRQEDKKCNRCKKTVNSGYTACPHCGCNEFS